ncbi:MAG TPA: Rieske 2Fe-2S domain-containing protein [Thermoanaerobaculia bacterium]|nr:Rieske 2Fe-2S domain-containing protein [Thermoanaerobaculia bacterium]
MEGFVEVARADELAVGSMRVVRVGERAVALYRTARGIFATDNTCPHRGGPLGEGDLMGDEIVCPWHFWTFNVETGCTSDPSGPRVCTHQVRIEQGRILIRLGALEPPSPETT